MSCDLISCREVGKQGKGKITDYIGEDSDDDLGDLSDEEIDFGDEFKMADDMEGDEEDCKYCLFNDQVNKITICFQPWPFLGSITNS